MSLAYDVYDEDENLIGRMRPTTEIILGMLKTQFLPDGKTDYIKGLQEGPFIYDEGHVLKLGMLVDFPPTMAMTYPPKYPDTPKRPVRIRETMGAPEDDYPFPDWKMV